MKQHAPNIPGPAEVAHMLLLPSIIGGKPGPAEVAHVWCYCCELICYVYCVVMNYNPDCLVIILKFPIEAVLLCFNHKNSGKDMEMTFCA